MVILVRLFGIVIVVMGIIFLLNPKALKQYIAFWRQQKRLYVGGILSLLFAVIFLLGASQCRLAWVIVIFGIWALIKGVLLFTLGQKRLNAYLDWWLGRPISIVRLLGIVALALGILIIYSA
ncbi:MAG: hypothetical protein JSW18_05680 [Candidatus Omnitrophota bacterium]|nr:MAG: hypothetical protein JSW18_05680 [Candidatus Omnitrophota bacterium]